MVMAAAGEEGRVPDLYQLLGVPRGTSSGEITQAWRRRALAQHPDRQPRDAAAPARFRALAEAYQVLGDPARRAAYDRSLGNQPGPAAPEGPAAGGPAGRPCGSAAPVAVRRAGRVPEPPLRAGPVRVEVSGEAPTAGLRTAEDDMVRVSVLAARYLAGGRGWPW
jgi:curved DNA-binding protein CbpA